MLSKRNMTVLIIVIVVVWVGSLVISRIMVPDKNPTRRYAGVIIGDKADKILKRVCFNCHSNETKWPWYTSLPVVSVLISSDVGEARDHLNFSDWESLSEDDRMFNLKRVFNEIEHDEMPPFIYRLGHPESKIEPDELKILGDAAGSMGITFNPKQNR